MQTIIGTQPKKTMPTIAPAPTETAPAIRRTTTKTAGPLSPLQERVAAISETAAKLALHLVAQQDRIDALAALSADRAGIHDALDRETVDYVAASAKLAGIADKYAALEFTAGKRAENVLSDAYRLRDSMTTLKHDLLAALNRAAGAAVSGRQGEVSALIGKWAGTPPPASPVPVLTIYSACSTCREIERHRVALEGWLPDKGPQAFQAVAGPAADSLSGMTVPDDAPLRWGGASVTGHAILAGWDGQSPGLEIVAVLDTPAEAMDLFHDLRGRSVFAGQRALYRLEFTHPEGQANIPPETARTLDWHENSAWNTRFPTGSGIDAGFIAAARAWLDLAPLG